MNKAERLAEMWENAMALTIYLSGPMTGIKDFNKPEFEKYAKLYRNQGFTVLSPPELDNGNHTRDYAFYIKRDIKVLLEEGVARIYMLPGWQKSRGASLEKHIAETVGIPVYDAVTGEPYFETVPQEAQRLVHGDRGEAYGHPLDDFGKTVGACNSLFGVVDKNKVGGPLFARPMTEEEQAMWMIVAKLSRQVNKPKRDNVVDIAGYAETLQMVIDERKRRKEVGVSVY